VKAAHRLTLLLLSATACSQGPPVGQALARVNGNDITRRDILVELTAIGAPADVDTETLGPVLLKRLIERELLVQEARRLSIDKSPEYLGLIRRDRNLLLVQLLKQRLAEQSLLNAREVGQHRGPTLREAPSRGNIYEIERITPLLPVSLTDLERLRSVDGALAWLSQQCIPFRRSQLDVYSRSLDSTQIASLTKAKGRLVAIRYGDDIVLDRVLTVRPTFVDSRERLAAEKMRAHEEVLRNRLAQLSNRLWAAAEIEYPVPVTKDSKSATGDQALSACSRLR
jgi:hypothetical protein